MTEPDDFYSLEEIADEVLSLILSNAIANHAESIASLEAGKLSRAQIARAVLGYFESILARVDRSTLKEETKDGLTTQ